MFWLTITRLGEAQLLLPALLAVALWLALGSRAPRAAAWWVGATGAAAVLTTITKVAFIGWGIGYAPLDFTGISGHAMFSAAILPLLAREAVADGHARWHAPAVALGVLLAALVAVSRVKIGAHSVSEAWAGFGLGLGASALALWRARLPQTSAPKLLMVALALWLVVASLGAPPSRTHGWVTALALELSGRAQPYDRGMLHRDWHLGQLLRRL